MRRLLLISLVVMLVGSAAAPAAGVPKTAALPDTAIVYTNDLWVDAQKGNDSNDGQTRALALKTVQAAANLAVPGTKIHILPGIYRESIVPAMGGVAGAPILYAAEAGPGTVLILGSESSSSLSWTRLASNSIGLPAGVDPKNVYYANISAWQLDAPPVAIAELDGTRRVLARFMPAREPDFKQEADWKVSEFWWAATGGINGAACDPQSSSDRHCDQPSRSFTDLTDTANDSDPGVQPGNLTSFGNLIGATLVALDAQHAHYLYVRRIVGHNAAAGNITVDAECDNDGEPGLGWGTKYYIENHPVLLDQPGEWWYDMLNGRIYMWAPGGVNPASMKLEISRRQTGFTLQDRSYIILDGLNIDFFNGSSYSIINREPYHKAFGNEILNSRMRYANRGVELYQYLNSESKPTDSIDGFTLKNSEIGYMDTVAIESYFWWPDGFSPVNYNHSGIRNVNIIGNEIHHVGFKSVSESAVAVRVFVPDKLRFEKNHLHDIAQYGAHLHLSLVRSSKEYDFTPEEILTGNNLIKDNVFESTCQLASDCGALVIGGSHRPSTHVYRDFLITGNVFRNIIAWSYVSVMRNTNVLGDGNGLYIDYASGLHIYRNISYNNSGAGIKFACLWRDGVMIVANNVIANNGRLGIKMTGDGTCDNHNGSVNTQLINNIFMNNDSYAIWLESAYATDNFGSLVIDHNLYFQNGWNDLTTGGSSANIRLMQGSSPTRYFHTLAEIQADSPFEDHGSEGDPVLKQYDPANHERYSGIWPNFNLTAASVNALDRGTSELPASLTALLNDFGVEDVRYGPNFDIGRYDTQLQPEGPAPMNVPPDAAPTDTPPLTGGVPNCMPVFAGLLVVPAFATLILRKKRSAC